jgi:hypothetical protein
MTQISHDFHVSVSMINSNQLGLMPTVYKNLMGLFSAKMTHDLGTLPVDPVANLGDRSFIQQAWHER